MSAVAGILRLDGGAVHRADLWRMLESMAYRAPDGGGVWGDGEVGLGQLMLRTTRESRREGFPSFDAARGLAITADARVDNRDELIEALGAAGRPRGEVTDSEVILAAYERWGEGCVEHLLGDFAFAIWDGRRRALFCARDHFGVRPFCYHRGGNFFVFASEIKALLCLPETPRRLNEARLADSIVSLPGDAGATLFQDVFRLPPAHCLTIGREGLKLRQYWALDPGREVRLRSDAEYADAYREILTEAVRCRLRRAGPVGSMLSGGIDTSSIVCVARGLLPAGGEKLHTFSAIYDEVPECDEREYIHAVVSQGGLEAHFFHADGVGPLTDWERTAQEADEPLWAPHPLHRLAYQAARGRGIRLMLDGYGGDYVVGMGYAYMDELAHTGRWIEFLKQTRATAKLHGIPWRKLARERGVALMAPALAHLAWRKLRPRRPSPPPQAPAFVKADFAARVGLPERLAAWRAEASRPFRNCREQQIEDCRPGAIGLSLARFDQAAARFQVEPRFPLLDRRIAEFCAALPPEQRFQRGWNRLIVRRALAGVLPMEVRRRAGKANMGPALVNGLLTIDREICYSVLLARQSPLAEFVDMNALRRLYERCLLEGCSINTALRIWGIISLALWLERRGLASKVAHKLPAAARPN